MIRIKYTRRRLDDSTARGSRRGVYTGPRDHLAGSAYVGPEATLRSHASGAVVRHLTLRSPSAELRGGHRCGRWRHPELLTPSCIYFVSDSPYNALYTAAAA
jgi:hypothetical protein